MRDHVWSVSATMNEIAHCRQDMQKALQPRPRAQQHPVTPQMTEAPAPTMNSPPIKKNP